MPLEESTELSRRVGDRARLDVAGRGTANT